jgi:arabinogalactan oligomer/maltooligosaccharide transport system permease protein
MKGNSLISALRYGGPVAWISVILMGFGNIIAGQFIKGLIFLAIEVAVIWYMFLIPSTAITGGGLFWLKKLITLGDVPAQEIWSDEEMVYITVPGDESRLILLYAVATIFIILAFAVMWRASIRSGYEAMSYRRVGMKAPSFWADIKALFDGNVHKMLMSPPFLCLIVFTIVPLVYMILMAFTNYDKQHMTMFTWVGFDNFKNLFSSGSQISGQFWTVLGWTLIWAFFATFLNFFFGTFVAMIINRPTTRLKGLWRTIFSLTIAIPQFVSLLIIRSMFQAEGIVNLTLRDWGLIAADESLPFLSNYTWARVLVIVINLWVGIPYTIMQVTGILKNIPADLYEAAKIDGANVAQQFIHITLPYMIFVMTPYIITSFTGNINNFNVIYLLTGGGPSTSAGDSAGKTDLLVTWLYKLSVDQLNYKLAAAIGILTFVTLAVVSLVTYRSTGSYKDEEGFK